MKQSILMIIAFTLVIGACSKSKEEAVTSAPPSPAPEGTPIIVPPPPSRPAAEDFAKSHPPAPAQPPPTGMPIEAKVPPANASNLEEGRALAKKSGCFACHDKEFKRTIIGPPWGAVAEKYRGRPEARDILIKWVHTGGSGRWGTSKMPPYSPQVPDDEIEKLVDFILSLPSPS